MKRIMLLTVVVITIIFSSNTTKGDLLTASIDGLAESSVFYWGDGINDLYQEWSVASPSSSGWFYGSSYSYSSNADVYVYSGLSDISLVTNASAFDYFDSSSETYPGPSGPTWAAWAEEGDTVFFKGTNGYYGAWYIEDIYPHPDMLAVLKGQWYFLDDGTSDFSIPESCTLLLLGLGGLLIRKR